MIERLGRILRNQRGQVVTGRAAAARPPIKASTLRKDTWWALPLTVVLVLGSFIVYSTWAGLQNAARNLVLQSSTCRDSAAALAGRKR